ncbi:MAG TPA: ABC transporter ATP-binding protein [Candidatus Dormibacteraeota bacterium]|nr:ABC transporter ATP-binding protein [Candidatus Dormibacteraeota bacterium]
MSPLLEVRDLEVHFLTPGGTVQAVRGVTFHIDQGESVALVGESGSGKSVTAQAIMGLVELPGHVVAGEVIWKGRPLSAAGRGEVARIRGRELAIVFQDPMTSLNPLLTIGVQITEVLRRHLRLGRRQAAQRALELLDLVGVSSPRQRLRQRPHELSGGMRQRVLIAIALACEPDLLIADEPTTALDVTIQAQILELLRDLRERLGLSLLLITHDLGVVAGTCDRILVMYAGRLAEAGTADEVFARPAHPYTVGLLRSTPRVDVVHPRLIAIEGSPPDLSAPPPGCAFHPRCPVATARCRREPPVLTPLGGREVACWNAFAASGVEATATSHEEVGR